MLTDMLLPFIKVKTGGFHSEIKQKVQKEA